VVVAVAAVFSAYWIRVPCARSISGVALSKGPLAGPWADLHVPRCPPDSTAVRAASAQSWRRPALLLPVGCRERVECRIVYSSRPAARAESASTLASFRCRSQCCRPVRRYEALSSRYPFLGGRRLGAPTCRRSEGQPNGSSPSAIEPE